MIAGQCPSAETARRIEEAATRAPIEFHDRHIADEEVFTYFRACDVVCLPFKKITTSGSVVLALSFGKPVITPRTGAQCELPDDVGYLYDPKEDGALESQSRNGH